jgi:hypothetical protein
MGSYSSTFYQIPWCAFDPCTLYRPHLQWQVKKAFYILWVPLPNSWSFWDKSQTQISALLIGRICRPNH